MQTFIDNIHFTLEINSHGFYELVIKDNIEVCIEDAILITKAQEEISGKKLPVLISGGHYSTTNIETLKFISQKINMPYSKASACIISSVSQKLLGNFYLKINKPQRPYKFFSTKEEATTWLKQYL